ncbi:DUF305 domain-containing protein [Spirosoma fluviale]|uniref:Uncharacterized conserved protein, DUF305 family n=1 Tax=Spirosoma fluviale TaxID=1597977 RepID=A0A286GN25_9BACT|nr:DUF305 domain-containing protein [Spirosoma fluviale]SOD96937.1 Uncharacterized conserved protein, DUF305 family [Spirosoma fluviale]
MIRLKKYGFLIVFMVYAQRLPAQHLHHGTPEQVPKQVYLTMMDTMMVRMAEAPIGNSLATVFLHQMIVHHQGAIAMANYEISHGTNREMIQLAKSIRVEQKSEIEQMRLWLKQADADRTPLPPTFQPAMDQTMAVMMNTMPLTHALTDTDKAFAAVMKPHHQAAIDMAKVLLRYSGYAPVTAYAKQLMANQQIEIDQMTAFPK